MVGRRHVRGLQLGASLIEYVLLVALVAVFGIATVAVVANERDRGPRLVERRVGRSTCVYDTYKGDYISCSVEPE